jgi:hypothetical protein
MENPEWPNQKDFDRYDRIIVREHDHKRPVERLRSDLEKRTVLRLYAHEM